jgi:hypothetical protein
MRKEWAVIAVVGASLACGGDAVDLELAEQLARSSEGVADAKITDDGMAITRDDGTVVSMGSEAVLPASWPSALPNYGAPLFATEVPGAVADKPDLSAIWTVADTLQQVADKYAALEAAGWKRGFVMQDATLYGGSWTSPDGKTALSITASPDATMPGKTSITAVVSNLP